MKTSLLAIFTMMLSMHVNANMEFNTNNNFCHFIVGEDDNGVSVKDGATVDGDNEVFVGNCINSIATRANIANGATRVVVKYPFGDAMPIAESIDLTGAETGTPCNMTDSNGVAYATDDWNSTYTVRGAKKGRNGKAKAGKNARIDYRLWCRDAPEQ